jgi:hypothetical protein
MISMMVEEWRDIEGYEGYYQISNYGEVRSLDRWRKNGTSGYVQKGQIIKPHITKDGYYRINLCKEGKYEHFRVHRLVAKTFIPNPNILPQVNHIDANKLNNRVDNLEWCTPQENTIHAWDNGLCSKESQEKRILCNQNNKIYKSLHQAARDLNLHPSNICNILKGKRKSTGGYTFEYINED